MEIKIRNNRELCFWEKNKLIGQSSFPIVLELWDGLLESAPAVKKPDYDKIEEENGRWVCQSLLTGEETGKIEITDEYEMQKERIVLKRKLHVLENGTAKGVRLWWNLQLFPQERPTFESLRYFAPPAIFDKNDLDEDGFEDYFHTQKVIFRDDRFNYPMFTAYSEKEKTAVRLERYELPKYDSIPERGVYINGEKAAVFLQKTDIGSMGAVGNEENGTALWAGYPFCEGEATIGLYIIKTVPFGAFWNLEKGEIMEVSYQISAAEYTDFHEAAWDSVKRVIAEKRPQADALPVPAEELVKWRLEALNRYYVEKTEEEDPNTPAGYVLNCHPQDGNQLENIIQYGFTGQNIMNACNILRYGYEYGDKEYIRRALRITDFFADKMQIKKSGMFYNLYNVDMKKMNFWWTGLLLPLAYAQGGELEELMGPLYEYRKEVIDTLAELEGAYLRCMNEDVTALLRIYLLEKEHGHDHRNWAEAVERYCEFLLKVQEEDGGWRRAYDTSGNPILEPKIWFGGTVHEQKSSTGTTIPLLVEMYRYSGEQKYLDAAKKAGDFVKSYIIDRVRFNGGVHDSIFTKGQLIDNESILYPMLGMLALYEETRLPEYLEGAIKAAHYFASWICLWKVPLPKGSTLEHWGFNSIGMGACDTCGAGYVHPFQLMSVSELAQIAVYAGDRELFETARLYWLGCNQTVSLPSKDWGYAFHGLQEEGYLVSWWAVDDPMFSADTGFGYRLKGEGNKTCFPWITAVGVKGYWGLIDRFGTIDFQKIYEENFS